MFCLGPTPGPDETGRGIDCETWCPLPDTGSREGREYARSAEFAFHQVTDFAVDRLDRSVAINDDDPIRFPPGDLAIFVIHASIEIGRESCRGRVEILVVAGALIFPP